MEVKIKQGEEMIDATIEMVDGVMVIISKKEKEKLDITQFKDGDIIVCSWSQCSWICILKGEVDVMTKETFFLEDYCGMYTTKGNYELWTTPNYSDSATHIRYATAEEQQKLFDKLAEEGLEWKPDTKELVKLKFEPKDGAVVIIDSFYPCIGIVRDTYSYGKLDTDRLYFSVGYWIESESVELKPFCACNRNTEPNYRPATEEEKQKLFDKLKEEGYEFDFEKKELVKLKWKPKINEAFYFPSYKLGYFISDSDVFLEDEKELLKTDTDVVRGWVFQTKGDCEQFCSKLNEAINSVKP